MANKGPSLEECPTTRNISHPGCGSPPPSIGFTSTCCSRRKLRADFSSPQVPLPTNLQAFAAPAPLSGGPADFTVETRLQLTGAERFSIAAFAQDTAATIRGDRRDARAEGYFQSGESLQATDEGFVVSWRVPFVARGIEKAADLATFNIGAAATRDMAITFVLSPSVLVSIPVTMIENSPFKSVCGSG